MTGDPSPVISLCFMKKLLLLLIMIAFAAADLRADHRYRLYFRDKADSQRYPLSERALDRRTRQGIALDSLDLEVSPTYLNALREAGYEVVVTSRWLNTAVIRKASGTAIGANLLADLPFVSQFQELSTTERIQLPGRRNLPSADAGKSPSATENFRTPIYEVHGEALLDHGYTGEGMIVAVIDAGFLRANQLQATRSRIAGGYDFVSLGYPSQLFTTDSHGEHCLSIMCAPASSGVWGTAPDASYYVVRTECADTETPYEEDAWVAGAEWADSIGADVISSSLGYYEFDRSAYNHTQSQLKTLEVFISQGANVAAHKGMLVCVAAGNERGTSWDAIDFPANVPDVLSVGATTLNLRPAYFSSPGWTVPYVKPDVSGRGELSYMINPMTGGVTTGNGTSYATPMIAGLCTSLWSAAPSLTVSQLLTVIRESGSIAQNPDSLMGYGLPNFSVALSRALQMADASLIEAPRDAASALHETPAYDMYGRRVGSPKLPGLYLIEGKKRWIVKE